MAINSNYISLKLITRFTSSLDDKEKGMITRFGYQRWMPSPRIIFQEEIGDVETKLHFTGSHNEIHGNNTSFADTFNIEDTTLTSEEITELNALFDAGTDTETKAWFENKFLGGGSLDTYVSDYLLSGSVTQVGVQNTYKLT